MKITLLGTGSPAVETDRQSSALLLQVNGAHWLFDAGRGVNVQLLRVGLTPANLDAIFITHHHWDHIGDLGDVLIGAWHAGRSTTLHVYGPQGTQALVSVMLNQVYAREIAFTLALQAQLGNPVADIRDLVEVHDVEPGVVLAGEAAVVSAEDVDHGSVLLPQAEWPCLGYRVEAEGKVVAISGDTVPCAGLAKLARDADVLVQCCYLADAEITVLGFEFLSRHVIASAGQAGMVAAQANVKKLVLTHFRPKSAALMDSMLADVRRAYAGDVILGRDLMEIAVS
ncbi:MAG: MBL fold metallo-hydrolase [Anaerolineae bacterium]|nr:MBL fold metallo-hydrolase [Anaerolineae bacterium]